MADHREPGNACRDSEQKSLQTYFKVESCKLQTSKKTFKVGCLEGLMIFCEFCSSITFAAPSLGAFEGRLRTDEGEKGSGWIHRWQLHSLTVQSKHQWLHRNTGICSRPPHFGSLPSLTPKTPEFCSLIATSNVNYQLAANSAALGDQFVVQIKPPIPLATTPLHAPLSS